MDNCPAHKGPAVRQWLEDHPDVDVIEWSAKSPDLNVIENVWGWMTTMWDPEDLRTPQELLSHAQKLWENLRSKPNQLANLVNSMPERIAGVLEREGGHIKY